MPYQLVEQILRRMPAKQLYEIEQNCPQIKEASQPLWKELIIKDFSDRPVPESHYRKVYAKYYKERQEHLKSASQRLRESMELLKREREARTITSLTVDPMAARSNARYRASKAAPPGMRAVQKAINQVKMRGPRFSSKNLKFQPGIATGMPGKPDKGAALAPPTKRKADVAEDLSPVEGPQKRPSQREPDDRGKNASEEPISAHRKVAAVKKKAPSIFLRSRR
jgi:hypothetical protein